MSVLALPHLPEATAPPPVRDGVRLLVSDPRAVRHSRFDRLADFLDPGDLVVVNTSATLAAAVDGRRGDGAAVTLHFATVRDDGSCVVEVRPRHAAAGPLLDTAAADEIELADEVLVRVVAPHPPGQHRLWQVRIDVDGPVHAYLARHGRPIRYSHVTHRYPLREYQTVFARHPGSAEMPSAGRPFTTELVTELVSRGIGVAPITLHTGVSSQEPGEPPQPERFRVPAATARQVNMTRAWGSRVVAVGTTVTRALESAADGEGVVRERVGWTDLVLGPDRLAHVVGGLITGWHVPGASHLDVLRAVAGPLLVERAYAAALDRGYLCHEFGDSALLLP